jgi:class 3 adenylate cyclase/tetratricopeptide (TPR) repeat protein
MKKQSVAASAGDRCAIIMFADLIGASVFSNTLPASEYDAVISAFQNIAARVLVNVVGPEAARAGYMCDMGVRGDEASLIMFLNRPPRTDDDRRAELANMSRIVIKGALDLRRAWILDSHNAARVLHQRKEPIGIGIGINAGQVTIGEHTRIAQTGLSHWRTARSVTPEGYSINLAKRIEGVSRNGHYSRIFVSQDVYNSVVDTLQLAFTRPSVVDLKGFIEPVPVYEILSAGHVEDGELILHFPRVFAALGGGQYTNIEKAASVYEAAISNNPRNFWLMMDLAHQYFDSEQYDDASRLYAKAIGIEDKFSPAHMYLGRCHYRTFDDQAAESHLREAVRLNPESARSNNFLGVCLRRIALDRKTKAQAVTDQHKRALLLQDVRRMLEEALGCHEKATRLGSSTEGKYIWASVAYAHTLSEISFLGAVSGSDASVARPNLAEQLKEAEGKVQKALAIYGRNKFTHGERKQRFLLLHTLGFVLHARGILLHGREKERTLRQAQRRYEEALRDLGAWEANGSRLKYHEKRAEIERHYGSSFKALEDNTKAAHHYGKALDELHSLQQIRKLELGCARDMPGLCRADTCDRSWTCLPAWWRDTRKYWAECREKPESEWVPSVERIKHQTKSASNATARKPRRG